MLCVLCVLRELCVLRLVCVVLCCFVLLRVCACVGAPCVLCVLSVDDALWFACCV